MNKLILVELLFLLVVIITMQMGVTDLARAGQVLIGIAALNLVLGLLTAFGWPVLRGDVSDFTPVNRQDSFEAGQHRTTTRPARPSRSFVLILFLSAFIALAAGAGLILMAP